MELSENELLYLDILIKRTENGACMDIITNQQKLIVIFLFQPITDRETSK